MKREYLIASLMAVLFVCAVVLIALGHPWFGLLFFVFGMSGGSQL